MPELERYMLARLAELDDSVRTVMPIHFNKVASALSIFAPMSCRRSISTSARISVCDRAAPRRRAPAPYGRSLPPHRHLVRAILCFTMEEAWLARFPGDKESVHLQTFFAVPKGWANPA